MAEENHQSLQVKLTRVQDGPAVVIRPGELNHVDVHVPQLEGTRCSECGQVLPWSYEPPADEAWTTRIFGCTHDPESRGVPLDCSVRVCCLGATMRPLERISLGQRLVFAMLFVEGVITLAILTTIFHGVGP